MSNYKAGIATAIFLDSARIFSPQGGAWWEGYASFVCGRYDTVKSEKWRAKNQKLPLCLHSVGETVFHWKGGDIWELDSRGLARIRAELLDSAGPGSGHPGLTEWPALQNDQSAGLASESLPGLLSPEESRLCMKLAFYYSTYGGDYWLSAVWSCHAFWEGLHEAGTRGVFVLEVGSEHALHYKSSHDSGLNYTYDVPNAAWPAWFLVLADLRGDKVKINRVYPPSEFIDAALKEGGEHESSLHFFSAFRGKMIEQALSNPRRESITREEFGQETNPWYIW